MNILVGLVEPGRHGMVRGVGKSLTARGLARIMDHSRTSRHGTKPAQVHGQP
jgi:hypothetical protein